MATLNALALAVGYLVLGITASGAFVFGASSLLSRLLFTREEINKINRYHQKVK